jgi:preprotein translocase subunit SecF
MPELNKKSTLRDSANTKIYGFTAKRKVFFIISIVLVVVSILSTFTGVDMDIEFKGGSIITYSYQGDDVSEDEVKTIVEDIVSDNGEGNIVTVQAGEDLSTGGNSLSISISSKDGITDDEQSSITTKLQETYADSSVELLDSNSVDASNGRDFFLKCIIAVIFAAIILILYIAIRFRVISGWSAGVFAIIALFHDIIITYGAFVLMGFDIDSNFMAVLLTIFGYSVNDTIVIYDRIRENQKLYPGTPIEELVDVSNSQTLRRSIRTSITTVSCMIIISIVAAAMGVTSILSFSLPLCFGLASGTYSSICLAPQLWIWWNKVRKNKLATKKSK